MATILAESSFVVATEGVAASDGTSTASAIGNAEVHAEGSAAGTSTATAEALIGVVQATGASAATSTASATAAQIVPTGFLRATVAVEYVVRAKTTVEGSV